MFRLDKLQLPVKGSDIRSKYDGRNKYRNLICRATCPGHFRAAFLEINFCKFSGVNIGKILVLFKMRTFKAVDKTGWTSQPELRALLNCTYFKSFVKPRLWISSEVWKAPCAVFSLCHFSYFDLEFRVLSHCPSSFHTNTVLARILENFLPKFIVVGMSYRYPVGILS